MIRPIALGRAILPAAVVGLVVVACNPTDIPRPSNALTTQEVEELFVGSTAFGSLGGRAVASYKRPDGSIRLKVRGRDGLLREFDGTHYFNEDGASCVNYPTLPVYPREFCDHFVPLEDGGYKRSFTRGTVHRIVEGEQLDKLK